MRSRPGPSFSLEPNQILLLLITAALIALFIVRGRQSVRPVDQAPGNSQAIRVEAAARAAQPAQNNALRKPGLFFQAGATLVGFSSGSMSLTNNDQMLLISFVDAEPVQPEVISSTPGTDEDDIAAELGLVRYTNLWPSITLICESGVGGEPRIRLTLAPGANPDRIRLQHNAHVAIEPDGMLSLSLPGGVLFESAPLAWQDYDGHRTFIEAAYVVEETRVGQVIGLKLSNYDPRYPLQIGPIFILIRR